MFSAKRAKKSAPKEIPEWKRSMEEAERAPARESPAGASTSAAGLKRERDEDEWREPAAAAATAAAASKSLASELEPEEARFPDDDDDDDDDVDLSRYKLDDDDDEEEAAPAPTGVIVAASNLAFETTGADLGRHLEDCGAILKIDVPPNNRGQRIAHVHFATEEDAQRACERTGSKLDGRRVYISMMVGNDLRDDSLETYGYSAAGRGNKYYGTVFVRPPPPRARCLTTATWRASLLTRRRHVAQADDDRRSLEKLEKLEHKRPLGRGRGRGALGQPTGMAGNL